MSLVSLVYLVLLSYAITPILHAQSVEEDEELQEWLQDDDESDETEESPLQNEADAASTKPAEVAKPVEQPVVAVQPPAITTKSDAPEAKNNAVEEPKAAEQPSAAATAAPSAEAQVEVAKPAEQSAATTAAPVVASDTKTAAPETAPLQAPAGATPMSVKEADAIKTEPKAAASEVTATDTKAEVAQSQPQASVAATAASPTAPVPAPEVTKETKTEESEVTPKAPEATPKPAEVKPAAEEPKKSAPQNEEKPAETAPVTVVKPEIPPLPEPPKPVVLTPEQQKQAAAEVEQGEIKSIDTVDLDAAEGNWLLKKIWWEKSNNLYGKIRSTVDAIAEARMHFYTEHMRVDRDLLDPFYTTVGYDQGQLAEIADTLTTQLEKKRQKKGSLDEQELEYYTTVANARTTIEGFKAAVQSVGQLSNDLRDALVKLVEQLNRVRSYESEAWRLLNAIAEELSDKKAREYYYGVLTQWQNIKEIDAYIIGPYSDHFGQLVQALQTQTKTIKESLDDLKDKGIKFGIAVQEHLEMQEQAEVEATQTKPAPKKGWWDWLTSFFS